MNSKLRYLFILTLVALPALASAQFTPMVGIPGVDADAGVGDYINALYILAISIAAFLAVVKLIIAGAKYIMTDVIPSKQSAKNDIKGALIGLLIVIGAALILETINPNLRVFSIFDNLNDNCGNACQEYDDEGVPTTPDPAVNDIAITCDFRSQTSNCTAARNRCLNEHEGEVVRVTGSSVVCRPARSDSVIVNPPLNPDGGDVETQPETSYYQRQNEDQIAAGDEPREIIVIGTNYIGGMVEVRYAGETNTFNIACNYIEPNPCVP